MKPQADPLADMAEELFEEAPCGYVTTRLDGTIIRVNRTFERWTGRAREELVGRVRFQDLLSAGGRIYHETHFAPLLRMQGSVREIALDVTRADGSALPALINSVVKLDDHGQPWVIRTTVFDATDRRRYEQELLRISRREHEIAQQLQQALLSGRLPVSPRLELEIFYSPAVRGLEVGGDWYDAFWIAEGETVGLVVGDVVGRGIGAATTMGQLRSAVRALAASGLGPAALLSALDDYSRRHSVGQMATIVYAELSLSDGVLRFACAGHPPPLILPAGEEPHFAWDGRSTPVGLDVGIQRPQATATLAPGAIVLLYTDGLIERRGAVVDDGMDKLSEEVGRARHEPLAKLVRGLARALPDPTHSDDICVVGTKLRRG